MRFRRAKRDNQTTSNSYSVPPATTAPHGSFRSKNHGDNGAYQSELPLSGRTHGALTAADGPSEWGVARPTPMWPLHHFWGGWTVGRLVFPPGEAGSESGQQVNQNQHRPASDQHRGVVNLLLLRSSLSKRQCNARVSAREVFKVAAGVQQGNACFRECCCCTARICLC
jgi:hypothetical protein